MVDNIRLWLEGVGLGQYADAFEQNEIEFDHLAILSEDDLKEIGVKALGHRKTFLQAIASVIDVKETALVEAPTDTSQSKSSGIAERRQLTVMFVDLVGSTALSGRLDPEEMREVITGYQNAVAGEVTRFDGHVAKYMGDGVLCYFGWPRAHEEDAERAVRAGLAIMQAMTGISAPDGEGLSARVGIATGLVVVGDLVGEGAAQEEAVIGETPNVAARLQSVAVPGQVVLAEATRRLLGHTFDLADLGPQI